MWLWTLLARFRYCCMTDGASHAFVDIFLGYEKWWINTPCQFPICSQTLYWKFSMLSRSDWHILVEVSGFVVEISWVENERWVLIGFVVINLAKLWQSITISCERRYGILPVPMVSSVLPLQHLNRNMFPLPSSLPEKIYVKWSSLSLLLTCLLACWYCSRLIIKTCLLIIQYVWTCSISFSAAKLVCNPSSESALGSVTCLHILFTSAGLIHLYLCLVCCPCQCVKHSIILCCKN